MIHFAQLKIAHTVKRSVGISANTNESKLLQRFISSTSFHGKAQQSRTLVEIPVIATFSESAKNGDNLILGTLGIIEMISQ